MNTQIRKPAKEQETIDPKTAGKLIMFNGHPTYMNRKERRSYTNFKKHNVR
jgi:hypothetical protein